MIGMYIHQHWPYNHPYAARTWTVDDWKGYVGGLHRLGYDTIMIWPVLETMPEPLTESDRSNLDRISRVIDMAHQEFGMRVYLALCPNVAADSAVAGQATFEERHFFHCDRYVNPDDKAALALMMAQREQLLRPLAKVDGVFIIDSDVGGYPGSTDEEFIRILDAHRKMLDRLRPGIELVYWLWFGWAGYSRWYQTARVQESSPSEFEDVLKQLAELNPEPWGLATPGWHLEQIRKAGLDSRVIQLRYGAIEGEPAFPVTNFGGDRAYDAGSGAGPRGVMGNAQTHCVQLPNTFAFVRGALGRPVTEADYAQFANELISGGGDVIVAGWKALAGETAEEMRAMAGKLQQLAETNLAPGPLEGLLFGDPRRFLTDLVMQLRFRAALEEFCAASEKNQDVRGPFAQFITALEAWQQCHGYENRWFMTRLKTALQKLESAEITWELSLNDLHDLSANKLQAKTSFGRVKEQFYMAETQVPRLIEAMKAVLGSL